MPEYAVDLVKARVLVNGSNQAFEDVSEKLGRLEGLNPPLIHWEILGSEGVHQELRDVLLLAQVLLLSVSVQSELLKSNDASQLGEEFVLS